MSKWRCFTILMCGPCLLALGGCGSDDETQSYSLVPVSGTVKSGGKPLAGAQMSFTPTNENKPSTPGEAFTDDQGHYEATFRGRSGLAPGKYQVTIAKLPTDKGQGSDPFMAQLAKNAASANTKTAPPPKIETTVNKEVPAGGGTLDFDVSASSGATASGAGAGNGGAAAGAATAGVGAGSK